MVPRTKASLNLKNHLCTCKEKPPRSEDESLLNDGFYFEGVLFLYYVTDFCPNLLAVGAVTQDTLKDKYGTPTSLLPHRHGNYIALVSAT